MAFFWPCRRVVRKAYRIEIRIMNFLKWKSNSEKNVWLRKESLKIVRKLLHKKNFTVVPCYRWLWFWRQVWIENHYYVSISLSVRRLLSFCCDFCILIDMFIFMAMLTTLESRNIQAHIDVSRLEKAPFNTNGNNESSKWWFYIIYSKFIFNRYCSNRSVVKKKVAWAIKSLYFGKFINIGSVPTYSKFFFTLLLRY